MKPLCLKRCWGSTIAEMLIQHSQREFAMSSLNDSRLIETGNGFWVWNYEVGEEYISLFKDQSEALLYFLALIYFGD